MNKIFKIFASTTNKLITRNVSYGQWKTEKNTKWGNIVHEAEKVVGYPISFLSLRWILNDEIANIARHISKLIGTNHPLLKTARDLLTQNETPTWGLIVLLISKTAGLNHNFTELECDRTADILHSQRILAEVLEMIKTSHLIHKGLINLDRNDRNIDDLRFGNQLALLCGDYLLAASFSEVAKLKNSQVQSIISISLRDLSSSEFIGPRTKQNEPLPCKPLAIQKNIEIPLNYQGEVLDFNQVKGHMQSEWIFRTILLGGSLLSNFCKATLVLSNQSEHVQNLSFEFGRYFVLAWQASLEREWIMKDQFSLTSAPVMLHLEDNPDFYSEIERGIDSLDDVDYDFVRNTILTSHSLEKTNELKNEFVRNCLRTLNKFDDSESRTALASIVKSL